MNKFILQIASELNGYKEEKEKLQAQLKIVETELEQRENVLQEYMLDNDLKNFTHNGVMFSLIKKEYASIIPDLKEQFVKDAYNDEYFRRELSIHTGKLNTIIRDLREANDGELPDWLKNKINFYEKLTIALRRGK